MPLTIVPAEAAEIEVRPVDPLHRHAERLGCELGLDVDRLEMLEQRRALVPGRASRSAR